MVYNLFTIIKQIVPQTAFIIGVFLVKIFLILNDVNSCLNSQQPVSQIIKMKKILSEICLLKYFRSYMHNQFYYNVM